MTETKDVEEGENKDRSKGISSFFRRLSPKEYFRSKSEEKPPEKLTIRAQVHSVPKPREIPPLRRRSSNISVAGNEEILVLEEFSDSGEPSKEKVDLSALFKRKRSGKRSVESDEEDLDLECLENQSSPFSPLRFKNNKLRRKKLDVKEEASDIVLEKLSVKKPDLGPLVSPPTSPNATALPLSLPGDESSSHFASNESSTHKEAPLTETFSQANDAFCRMKNGTKPESLESEMTDKSQDLAIIEEPRINKLKRHRPKKTKEEAFQKTADVVVHVENKTVERRMSSRVKITKDQPDFSFLSSSDEEDNVKRPRKVIKVGKNSENKVIFDETIISPKKRNTNSKLASIFVRQCPEASAARKAFLQSEAPEIIKIRGAKESSAASLGLDYFNDFSYVPHINYATFDSSSTEFKLPREKDIEVNNLVETPTWELPCITHNETLKSKKAIENHLTIPLPLNNVNLLSYIRNEPFAVKRSVVSSLQDRGIGTSCWAVKYAPKNSSEIIGNEKVKEDLKEWLRSFSVDEKSDPKEYDPYLDDDSRSSSFDYGNNAVVLCGPHGSGKTSTIYALASELNFKVLEVNASSLRGGRQIASQLHEATQSHRLQNGKKDHIASMFNQKSKIKAGEDPERKNNLILFEDIDVVFEDADEGFYQALSGIIASSKRPIVLTYSSITKKLSIPLPKIDQINFYQFACPPIDSAVDFLYNISLKEGYPISKRSINNLLEFYNTNIGKSLLEMQFFALSSSEVPASKCENAQIEDELDEQLRERLGLNGSCFSKLFTKPECIELAVNRKKKIAFTRKVVYPTSAKKEICKGSLKKRTYSCQEISDMEDEARKCERLSASIEDEEEFEIDYNYFNSSYRIESSIINSLHCVPRTTTSGLNIDTIPLLRSIARIEEDKRVTTKKRPRRFLHYFNSQLEIHLSTDESLILCNTLQC